MKYIDLHTHSNCSDGSDSPEELVEKAAKSNLFAIALTDHDTLAGIDKGAEKAKSLHITFIPACEVSTKGPFGSLHILGLWTPTDNNRLNIFLKTARENRERRNEKMLAKLHGLGLEIQGSGLEKIPLESLGRPHMAKALAEQGLAKNIQDAFKRFLGKNGLAYIPKDSPHPQEAIAVLAQAGATVCWAHPLLNPLPPRELEQMVKIFSKAGLSALEAYHSAHEPAQSRFLKALAEKNGLGISGGSDYHGSNKPKIKLGSGMNNLVLKHDILDDLTKMRKERGLPC